MLSNNHSESDGVYAKIAIGGEIGIVHDLLHEGGTEQILLFNQHASFWSASEIWALKCNVF